MSYDVSYKGLPRWQADDKAIEDIKNFVGEKSWALLREAAEECRTGADWQAFNNSFGLVGVRGYPVHAFGRRYCLTAYREWMHSGDDAVQTDAHGFKITAN